MGIMVYSSLQGQSYIINRLAGILVKEMEITESLGALLSHEG